MGFEVKTLDLDPSLSPDFLVSFTDKELLKKIGQYNIYNFSEVFEHVEYSDFLEALDSLKKCTSQVLFTVPDTNEGALSFGFRLRLPLYNNIQKCFKIRYKKIIHKFDGEHYWEIGKKNYSAVKVRKDIRRSGRFRKSFLNMTSPIIVFT